jgi:hypothetical protein
LIAWIADFLDDASQSLARHRRELMEQLDRASLSVILNRVRSGKEMLTRIVTMRTRLIDRFDSDDSFGPKSCLVSESSSSSSSSSSIFELCRFRALTLKETAERSNQSPHFPLFKDNRVRERRRERLADPRRGWRFVPWIASVSTMQRLEKHHKKGMHTTT